MAVLRAKGCVLNLKNVLKLMANFFGRLKVEMLYGEKFEGVNPFIGELNKYIYYIQQRTHFN